MKIKLSLSNAVTRRKARKAAIDNVDGNRIKIEGPKIVRRLEGENVRQGAALLDDPLKVEDEDTGDGSTTAEPDVGSATVVSQKDKKAMSKIKVSMSGDVIFTPYTDGTQYACRRDATANLRRRMPDFNVMLSDVTGEGQIDFTVSSNMTVEGQEVSVTARGLASPYEMAVHTITVYVGENTVDINPIDRARSPEDTVNFLKRIALNTVKGKYAKNV